MAEHDSTHIAFDNLMYDEYDDFRDTHAAFVKMAEANRIRVDIEKRNSAQDDAEPIYEPYAACGYIGSHLIFTVAPLVWAEYLDWRAKRLAPQLFEI